MKRAVRVLQGMLIFLGIAVLVLFGYFYATNHYCRDTIPNTNSIYIYTVDESFGQLNQRYAAYQDLEIDETLYSRYAGLGDVPEIAAIDGVEQVYLFDDVFFLQDGGFIDRASEGDLEVTASIPRAVYDYYANASGIWSLFIITEGAAPRDGAGEIALSADWLEQLYGITEPAAALGQELEFSGQTYTLCGVHSYPFAWISFQVGDGLGYYTYDPETFQQFQEETLAFWEEQDGVYQLSALVECENLAATQEQVQNLLMQTYPGSNYLSKAFVTAWKTSFNQAYWRMMALAAAIVVIIVVCACVLLQRWYRKKTRQAAEDGQGEQPPSLK